MDWRSRPFDVIYFWTNRKSTGLHDFLLAINCNLRSISHRLRDIAQRSQMPTPHPTLSPTIKGSFEFRRQTYVLNVGAMYHFSMKTVSVVLSQYTHVTDRRTTNRQQTTHYDNCRTLQCYCYLRKNYRIRRAICGNSTYDQLRNFWSTLKLLRLPYKCSVKYSFYATALLSSALLKSTYRPIAQQFVATVHKQSIIHTFSFFCLCVSAFVANKHKQTHSNRFINVEQIAVKPRWDLILYGILSDHMVEDVDDTFFWHSRPRLHSHRAVKMWTATFRVSL